MRLVREGPYDPAPWLWGVNGAAGVVASALAVAVSIAFGIDTTMYLGAACYAGLALVVPGMFVKKR
ncbi:MAG: hypothetical protein M5R36_09025 [Deltaproteobacteria bacterium]|nr:hypothetical protein [Deltaproteobacteria bacterium]